MYRLFKDNILKIALDQPPLLVQFLRGYGHAIFKGITEEDISDLDERLDILGLQWDADTVKKIKAIYEGKLYSIYVDIEFMSTVGFRMPFRDVGYKFLMLGEHESMLKAERRACKKAAEAAAKKAAKAKAELQKAYVALLAAQKVAAEQSPADPDAAAALASKVDSHKVAELEAIVATEDAAQKAADLEAAIHPDLKDFKYPLVLSYVYYDGRDQWNADLNLASRTELSDVAEFSAQVLNSSYTLINLNDYTKEELLDKKDVISYIFFLDKLDVKFVDDAIVEDALQRFHKDLDPELFKMVVDFTKYFLHNLGISKEKILKMVDSIPDRGFKDLFAELSMEFDRMRQNEENARLAEEKAKKAEEEATKVAEEAKKAEEEAKKAEEEATKVA
jgi:hypothetical protein